MVRGILVPHHTLMRDLRVVPIARAIWSRSSDRDQFILNSLNYVHGSIEYVEDGDNQGQNEYVQMPGETMQLGKGDCEDVAILLLSILWAGGVFQSMEVLGFVHISHRWVRAEMSQGQFTLDPTGGLAFPTSEERERGYKALWYVTPFSIQPAQDWALPLFLPL
jgi:predicted transglutaminase-like cysteine proteinase